MVPDAAMHPTQGGNLRILYGIGARPLPASMKLVLTELRRRQRVVKVRLDPGGPHERRIPSSPMVPRFITTICSTRLKAGVRSELKTSLSRETGCSQIPLGNQSTFRTSDVRMDLKKLLMCCSV